MILLIIIALIICIFVINLVLNLIVGGAFLLTNCIFNPRIIPFILVFFGLIALGWYLLCHWIGLL